MKSYIVYLGSHSHGPDPTPSHMERATDSHHKFLASFLGSKEKAKESIFYSYNKHINGFAARLDEEHAEQIAKHPDIVSIFENKLLQLHTTRSWEFLGLEKGGSVPLESLWKKGNFGEDIIIANLDTGISPEYKSFSDEGYGPVPSKWRGVCESGRNDGFKCNRKLIGARYFDAGFRKFLSDNNITLPETYFNARDGDGHGTHTLATAGGNFVANISVMGNGNGTVKGGAPRARVVSYKIAWSGSWGGFVGDPADALQAFDTAIYDGVDVISASVGFEQEDYFKDPIAIGSFHAIKKGVIVVCSAGNSGPDPTTIDNEAPWLFTVAASTTDRDFVSYVTLGNGKKLQGASLSNNSMASEKYYPVIDGVSAKLPDATDIDAMECYPDALDTTKTEGKVLVCVAIVPKKENAKGLMLDALPAEPATRPYMAMVTANDNVTGNYIPAEATILPSSNINFTDGQFLFDYMETTK
ncbi:hypothetical protein Q3G72_019408 [Acer saccharum]|nr:hypothetical protein Q3G72_019408 [Acer saccharum]